MKIGQTSGNQEFVQRTILKEGTKNNLVSNIKNTACTKRESNGDIHSFWHVPYMHAMLLAPTGPEATGEASSPKIYGKTPQSL